MKKIVLVLGMAAVMGLIAGSASATELVFQFTNPSFGGNPLMGSFLLSKANSQNDKTAPRAPIVEPNPLEDFSESLERQILNRLSRDIVDRVFGDEGIEPGNFEVGGFQVEVIENLDSITLTIVDIETGNETTIKLPFF
jgi:curli production assembly/transport component CsgF